MIIVYTFSVEGGFSIHTHFKIKKKINQERDSLFLNNCKGHKATLMMCCFVEEKEFLHVIDG